MEKIRAFLHGVKKEVERVRWPSKKNLFKYSTAVLIFCLFFGIFFYLINTVAVLIMEALS